MTRTAVAGVLTALLASAGAPSAGAPSAGVPSAETSPARDRVDESSREARLDGVAGARPVYLDMRYTAEERAADLVSRMTLREKAGQLGTTNAPAIERLGVQGYAYWSESQHGVSAFFGGYKDEPIGITTVRATSFPTNLAASLTWDPDLVRREAAAISDEARGLLDPSLFGQAQNNLGQKRSNYGHLFYWAPTVNMLRDPRWGRQDEAFGEDPFLTGTLGSAWVQGFQGTDSRGRPLDRYLKAVATLKHYALNNNEAQRTTTSSDTTEAAIRDYYTAQFRQVVEQAGASGVMSSYNAVNGVPAVANNFLLNVLLRKTFGFEGYTTSDCGGVGTTYHTPKPDNPIAELSAVSAVGSGHDWAPPGWVTDHLDTLAHWYRFVPSAAPTVVDAPAGASAFSLRAGNALNCVGAGAPDNPILAFDYIRPVFGWENSYRFVAQAIAAGILSEDTIDRQLLPVFTLRMRLGEFDPRSGQRWTRLGRGELESGPHLRLAEEVATRSLTLLQNRPPVSGRPPLLPLAPARLRRVVVLGDLADETYLGGYSGNPVKRVSLVQGLRHALPDTQVTYSAAGTSTTATGPAELTPSDRRAIRGADAVIVMIGTDDSSAREGADRSTLDIPGNYADLVDQVAAVGNPRVALLVQSAGPIALGTVRKKVAAILYSAANGQRQGSAAASVLLGKHNPTGRLSFTWFADETQLPPILDYDLTPGRTGGRGRTYQYFTGRPEFPFGFGLSYTRFRIDRARLSAVSVAADGEQRVLARVTNTGQRAGSTVVQVYARHGGARGEDPKRRLVGFARTAVLRPGASTTVTVDISLRERLRRWDARRQRMVVDPGRWILEIAQSTSAAHRRAGVRRGFVVRGRLGRDVDHVVLAPPRLVMPLGSNMDLLGRNPWSRGLAPAGLREDGSDIVTAVRRDDTFAELGRGDVAISSSRPGVVRIGADGLLHARGRGVTTITVTVGGRSASTAMVVR